jgi:hypothetical protein
VTEEAREKSREQRTSSGTTYTSDLTSKRRAIYPEPEEFDLGDVPWRPSTTLHLDWGRVVPDIPDFCRELVFALAEE